MNDPKSFRPRACSACGAALAAFLALIPAAPGQVPNPAAVPPDPTLLPAPPDPVALTPPARPAIPPPVQSPVNITPSPAPPSPPPVQSPASITPSPGPAAEDADLQPLQFLDVEAAEILSVYEQLTGKILVRDAQMGSFKLYIDSQRPISKEERIRLIEATLFLNGFTFIPDKGNMIKVLGPQKAPLASNQAIRLISNEAEIPDTDDIANFFMPLEFLDPASTAQLFQQLLGQQPNPFAKYVPAPNASAIIITDKGNIILELIKLRKLIDVSPSRLATKFVQLERADAERVAQILQEVIEARNTMTQTASRSSGGPGGPPQQPPQNAPEALLQAIARQRGEGGGAPQQSAVGGATDFNVLSRDTTLVADPRTNRILVITHPSNFEYVKDLIMEFDIAVELTKPFIRPLRYVQASEVMPILSEVLQEEAEVQIRTSEGGAIAPGGGGGIGSSRSGLTQPRSGTSGSRTSSSRSSSSRTSTSSRGSSARGGIPSGRSGGSGGIIDEGGPQSISIGKIRLIADDRSNIIMVMGPPESVNKVQTIVDELDKKPKQVYLAVVIGRLAIGENLDYAADVFQKFYPQATKNKSYGAAAGSRNRLSVDNLVGGVAEPRTLDAIEDFLVDGVATGAGLTIYGSISKSIDAFLEALESTDRFEIVSRPSIYTANNRSASIINGERIAVPASTIQSDTGDNFRTNIEYEEIVLQIEVTPLINSENEITLQIYQLNETQSGTTVIDGNPIPDIATQELSTEITVPNRSTVLLGGLITTQVGDSSRGVPLLHRIPILGALAGGKSNSGSKTELVILIQPVVLDTHTDTMQLVSQEMDQTYLGSKWLESNGITNANRGPDSLTDSYRFERDQEARRQQILLERERQILEAADPTPVALPALPPKKKVGGR